MFRPLVFLLSLVSEVFTFSKIGYHFTTVLGCHMTVVTISRFNINYYRLTTDSDVVGYLQTDNCFFPFSLCSLVQRRSLVDSIRLGRLCVIKGPILLNIS